MDEFEHPPPKKVRLSPQPSKSPAEAPTPVDNMDDNDIYHGASASSRNTSPTLPSLIDVETPYTTLTSNIPCLIPGLEIGIIEPDTHSSNLPPDSTKMDGVVAISRSGSVEEQVKEDLTTRNATSPLAFISDATTRSKDENGEEMTFGLEKATGKHIKQEGAIELESMHEAAFGSTIGSKELPEQILEPDKVFEVINELVEPNETQRAREDTINAPQIVLENCEYQKDRTKVATAIAPPQISAILSRGPELKDWNTADHSNSELARDVPVAAGIEAEFELDSSPIGSQSDTSSDSTSDDSSDEDYEMLNPAEQARRLMQEDGGSDDEGGNKRAACGPLRTLNEKPDEVVEKPTVTVTADMKIEELGDVETIVENIVLVKAKTTGEYQVLEIGSVLCLEDRSVIGAVSETLGRVQQPLYSVRFTNTSAISEVGITKGTCLYYVPQHSTYVFTQTLKVMKGSDASNIHDEEVGDDELEFSDDEAEAEFKRSQKLQRQARRGGREGSTNGVTRGPRSNRQEYSRRSDEVEKGLDDFGSINYDDPAGDDGLYTPLVRPSNLHEQMRQKHSSSVPQHGTHLGPHRGVRAWGDTYKSSGSRGGRGRFGRDRGAAYQKGYASGRPQQHLGPPLNESLPQILSVPQSSYAEAPKQSRLDSPATLPHQTYPLQQAQNSYIFTPRNQFEQPHFPYNNSQVPDSQSPQMPPLSNLNPSYQQYQQHNHILPQHFPPQQPYHAGQLPHSSPVPVLPPGAFVNPAFFHSNQHNIPNQQHFPPYYHGYTPQQQNGYHNR
ncbi:hypothetical protein MMC19_007349 [Ptychographa xylographoides]|nr:hypothetical protein [Ptychographa xylographoides]